MPADQSEDLTALWPPLITYVSACPKPTHLMVAPFANA